MINLTTLKVRVFLYWKKLFWTESHRVEVFAINKYTCKLYMHLKYINNSNNLIKKIKANKKKWAKDLPGTSQKITKCPLNL